MFQQIAELAVTTHETAVTHLKSIRSLVGQMRMLRRLLVDSQADAQEKTMMLSSLDDQIDLLEKACDFVAVGAMDEKVFSDEIYEALLVRLYPMTNLNDVDRVRQLLRERANNISVAYSGRVLCEQKR